MKKYLIFTSIAMIVMCKSAMADFTLGIGIGPLYSGIGLNYGKTAPKSFTYGSLGCIGFSTGESANYADGEKVDEQTNQNSNCGFGFGHISTSMFTSNKHGLGLNIGLTHNTFDSRNELRIAPGYHYFFNGIDKPGATLGIGAMLYAGDSQSGDEDDGRNSVFLNIGYQF